MHAASGSRLGAAGPRPEGPVDLRLVGPALAAWAAAAVALGAPGDGVASAVALCGAAAGGLLLGRRRRGRWWGTAVAAAGVLLGAAAGAASAGLHGADLRRGPVPGLAEGHARVAAEVTVVSDPRPLVPRVRGNRAADTSVLVNAEVTEVTGPDGSVTRVRTPVLLITRISAGERGGSGGPGPTAATREADGDEEVKDAWMRLLPSTGLRLSGRLAPPGRPGDPYAAVLYVDGGPPRITAPPNTLQRTAGTLREGLRTATDGLPPDARALLPGLVVGDTSRMTQELRAAFEATDLTHLTAVSGDKFTRTGGLLVEISAGHAAGTPKS